MAEDIRFRVSIDGVQQVQQGANQVAGSLDRVGQSGSVVSRSLQAAGDAMDSISGALAGVGVGVVAAQFVKAADAVTVLQNRLQLASGSATAAATAYGALYDIAQRSRTSFTELGATYASIAQATSELGVSQARLLKVTESIGNALAISGGSAEGMKAALVQLGQGIASGTLRGEELNSVLEQTPRLARAIADGMGVTVGKLRELGKEGQITAEAVLKALESQSDVLAREVGGSVATVSQSMTQLGNAATFAVGEIDRVTGSSASLGGVIQGAAQSVEDIARAFKDSGAAAQNASTIIGDGIGVAFETVAVLGVNTAYVLKQVGNELGGLGAQVAAIASGQFAEAAAIGRLMREDAEKARKDVDALTARLLQTRQLRRLAEQSTAGLDNRAEEARLARLTGGYEKVAIATKKSAAELQAARREEEKQADVIAALNGLTGDYSESLSRLVTMRAAGKVTEQEYVKAVEQLIAKQPFAIDLAKRQTEVEKEALKVANELAAARRKESDAIDDYLRDQANAATQAVSALEGRAAAVEAEGAALEVARQKNVSLATAIELVTLARLRDRLELTREGSAARQQVEDEIAARERLIRAMASRDVREANAAAAADATRRWEQTADQIGQALTDAIVDGGKSAGDLLQSYFRSLVLTPIIRAIVDPVSGAIAAFLTGGASGGGAGGATAAGLNNASSLYNLYSATTGYSSGVNALAGYLGAGTAAGASSLSLGYANAVGAVGGDSLGALIASNGSWAGVGTSASQLAASEAATLFASQATAEGITVATAPAATGGSSALAGWGTYAAYAALVYAAAKYADKLYGQGFTGESQIGGTSWYDNTFEAQKTNLLQGLGMSEKWAQILGGSVRLNHLFGRAEPRVTGAGVMGTFSGGGFSGETVVDVLERGGVFRSDKRYTKATGVVEGAMDAFFDDAAASVVEQAKAYGKALGLAPELMAGITKDVKVTLTGDIEKDKVEIAKALGEYGDALIAGYADAVKPLAQYGETTSQTIQRVGGAILQVNDVLDAMGRSGLQASISGGQAAVSLEKAFGNLDTLRTAAGGYIDKFIPESERIDMASDSVAEALGKVGLAMPATRDAFRDLVDAQDLNTDAGRKAFVALMSVAGAFDSVTTAADAAVQSAQQLVDQNIGKFIQGPELEQYRYGRIADNLTKAGVQVSGGQLAALSKDEVLAIARQFVDFRDGINEMELAVLGAVGPLADLKDSAKDAADALNKQAQDLIDQNIGKLLSGADLQKYQYGRIAGNLAGANVNVSVDELMGLSRPDVIKATQALVDFSDGVSKAELTILEAGFALLDLKDASAAAADNFKGFGTRISSMSQIESAKQGYVDALGLAVKSEQFQADFDAGTLPKNLQDYVDSFPGGKDEILGPTISGLFNQYAMQKEGPQNLGESLDRQRREAAEAAGANNAWEQIRGEEQRRQEELEREQIRATEQLTDSLNRTRDELSGFLGELETGGLSALSGEDRLKAARSQYEDTLTKANNGDLDAAMLVDDFARSFLSLQKEMTGAATYAPVADEVAKEVKELRATMQRMIQAQTEATAASGVAITDLLQNGNRLTSQQLSYSQVQRGRSVASI
jgi:tape measure domain-containing protein